MIRMRLSKAASLRLLLSFHILLVLPNYVSANVSSGDWRKLPGTIGRKSGIPRQRSGHYSSCWNGHCFQQSDPSAPNYYRRHFVLFEYSSGVPTVNNSAEGGVVELSPGAAAPKYLWSKLFDDTSSVPAKSMRLPHITEIHVLISYGRMAVKLKWTT